MADVEAGQGAGAGVVAPQQRGQASVLKVLVAVVVPVVTGGVFVGKAAAVALELLVLEALLAFKRAHNSWHGHEPFVGERRVEVAGDGLGP